MRRRRKSRVGKIDVADNTITAIKSGAEILAGFSLAEFVANFVGEQFPAANSNNGRIAVKSVGAVATVALAFTRTGRKYQKDLLNIAGGMAANAAATGVKKVLPANLQPLLPTVNGHIGATYVPRSLPEQSVRNQAAKYNY